MDYFFLKSGKREQNAARRVTQSHRSDIFWLPYLNNNNNALLALTTKRHIYMVSDKLQ